MSNRSTRPDSPRPVSPRPVSPGPDFELDDDRLRRTQSVKWTYAGPEVLPAWVAELDVAVCPPVAAALHRALHDGVLGYPALDRDTGLPEATAGFLADRLGWRVDPSRVIATGDVMAGVMLTLQALCEPGPVVVPVPSYPPFLAAVPWTGRELAPVPMLEPAAGSAGGWALDLERIDAALAAGARTVLLANPHNPTGRCFSRPELEGLRDVVLRHGARVISDEIHAPLVLPGAAHTPYATLEGTAEHVTSLVAASKAWNLPGLKCAQLIPGSDRDVATLAAVPPVANHGTSPLGIIATVAAYTEGRPWLDSLVSELADRRAQLEELIAAHLPPVAWVAPEATYLAWLDARDTGLADPAASALSRAKVLVNRGTTFAQNGCGRYDGFVRVNFGTSPERLERIVKALAEAWNR
jgi:cysteine-S-conjugate beta-lyase